MQYKKTNKKKINSNSELIIGKMSPPLQKPIQTHFMSTLISYIRDTSAGVYIMDAYCYMNT